MKKWSYKYLLILVMLAICGLLCAFMWQYGFLAVLITVLASVLLIVWSVYFYGVFTGLVYADNKLIRFFRPRLDWCNLWALLRPSR